MRLKTLERKTPLYLQIYGRFRNAIASKELQPGTRIPASSVLAREFGAGVDTVQSALSALEREGLIERRQKVGTFVKGDTPRISSVGIYFATDFWRRSGMDSYRLMCGELQRLLDEERISYRIFIDPEDSDHKEHFPPELLKAARSREIQAVISPLFADFAPSAFDELSVPLVKLSSGRENGSCDFDYRMMFDLAAGYFLSKGCRSIGMISSAHPSDEKFFRNFREAARGAAEAAGLETKERWILMAGGYVMDNTLEEYGYRQMLKLAGSGSLPDGLFIHPDIAARGVIMGILEKGIKVPGDMEVAIHGNRGISVFKPFPAATIEVNLQLLAKALLSQVREMSTGRETPPLSVPFELIPPKVSS